MLSTVRHDTPHAVEHFSSHVAVGGSVWHCCSHEFSHVARQRQLQPAPLALAEHSAPQLAEHLSSQVLAQIVCGGLCRHSCTHWVSQLVVHSCFGSTTHFVEHVS
jgi:hypothetical protein